MEYYKLVAVTGLPGLYELISSKKDGAIVRSLQDNTTKFASTRIHQFSHLESIEIYTIGDNVNLVEVFNAMDKNETALPDAKDEKGIKAYFQQVYPDLDFDRVYNSDMKKIVKWFDILKKNNIEIKLSEPAEEEETDEEKAEIPEPAKQETKTTEKPEKKAAAKKAAKAPSEPTASKEENSGEEGATPAKAAPKKAAAKKKAAPKKKDK